MYVIKASVYKLKDDVLSKYNGQKLRAVPQNQDTLSVLSASFHGRNTQLVSPARKILKENRKTLIFILAIENINIAKCDIATLH